MWSLGTYSDTVREIVDEAQARAIIVGLRAGVNYARAAVNYLTPTTLSEAFLATPIGLLIRWASPDYANQLLSDHKKAALKAIDDTVPLIDKLAGEWWNGAATGIPAPDGTATWTEWKRKAGLIASALQAYVAYQPTVGPNLVRLVADLTITVVNCVTNPEKCLKGPGIPSLPIPTWAWVGAGAVALLGGAYVFNTFAPRRR